MDHRLMWGGGPTFSFGERPQTLGGGMVLYALHLKWDSWFVEPEFGLGLVGSGSRGSTAGTSFNFVNLGLGAGWRSGGFGMGPLARLGLLGVEVKDDWDVPVLLGLRFSYALPAAECFRNRP